MTVDLLPVLPRRCDLTDVAHEGVADLEEGKTPWRVLKGRLDDAADEVVAEALAEMGWGRHRWTD